LLVVERHNEDDGDSGPPATSLRRAWDQNAGAWERWAGASHDSYWRFHGRRFFELLPSPGRLTVDIGSGEGRLGRGLIALGHRVVPVDASVLLARAAASHEVPQPAVAADAAALPLRPGCADLVIAFMSLQDVDDLVTAISEAALLLAPHGWLCIAIVHPLNSAGTFEGERGDRDAPFVVRGSYLAAHRYRDDIERDGLAMTFHSEHRPLEAYTQALEQADLAIEAIREVTDEDPAGRWSRIPLFLHLRASRSKTASG
jgi:SAM-dependent methyltransferase